MEGSMKGRTLPVQGLVSSLLNGLVPAGPSQLQWLRELHRIALGTHPSLDKLLRAAEPGLFVGYTPSQGDQIPHQLRTFNMLHYICIEWEGRMYSISLLKGKYIGVHQYFFA